MLQNILKMSGAVVLDKSTQKEVSGGFQLVSCGDPNVRILLGPPECVVNDDCLPGQVCSDCQGGRCVPA